MPWSTSIPMSTPTVISRVLTWWWGSPNLNVIKWVLVIINFIYYCNAFCLEAYGKKSRQLKSCCSTLKRRLRVHVMLLIICNWFASNWMPECISLWQGKTLKCEPWNSGQLYSMGPPILVMPLATMFFFMKLCKNYWRAVWSGTMICEKGSSVGESTGLPPMWPGFDSRIGSRMWVEFVGSLLCSERFFPGYSGFPLSPISRASVLG